MSKTIETQINKSQTLIEGLRRNINELSSRGISETDITNMDSELNLLSKANRECDAIRDELSKKVRHMNEILCKVKDQYAEKKKIIKGYYPQTEWTRYGVIDKR